ncbi:TetR/AcrR family transcriptional regulator [Streptomyces iconiensis]|uniref:TetR family transcriptional regulator n=1 Tax=Streptomyces iconiensis TaxID=1384038 RepID=A0ABT6ZPN7_9ACTN|nr:TetR family transcriptional regulator [Streptomyces iconiensis]MDJ1130631.1 TetR family transcriptional regulator [Streptomyces iconiensis]
MTGLRERKKQRTRDALIRAAHELFITQGYEATTVDQIAEAVEVSQRTFFRYFTNKEEVALFVQGMVTGRFQEAFRTRPIDEHPMESLRHTLDATWDGLSLAIGEIVPLELHMKMWQVIEMTPALVTANLRLSLVMEEKLAMEIARRTGVDIDRDPRPRVLVAAFAGVMSAAGRQVGLCGDASLETARRVTNAYVDHLGPALSADWSRDHGSCTV